MIPWHIDMMQMLLAGNRLDAMKVIEPHIPARLFKYMRASEYSFENLRDDKFFMSYPSQYNDPYDSLLNLIVEGADQDDLDKIYNSGEKIGDKDLLHFIVKENETWEQILASRETIKCCSFSELNDSILMWSHYAEHHKGICVEYDFKELENRSLENELYPIRYQQNLAKFSENEDFDNIYLTLMASLFKSSSWKYEREWRIIIPSEAGFSDERGNSFVNTPKPVSLFLGAQMNRAEYKRYISLAREKNINAYSVHVNPRKFRLEFLREYTGNSNS